MCIPQALRATDYYVRGAYGTGDWGSYNTGNYMTPGSNSTYTLEYTSTQDGEFRFRFAGSDWKNSEMCPYTSTFDLTTASPSYKIEYYTRDIYGNETTYKDNYFYVKMTKGKTYVFTLVFNGSTPYVSCKVKESTGGDDFKFYIMGGYKGETWSSTDVSRPFVAAGNSKYSYTFTDIENTFYFRVRGVNSDGSAFDKQLAPNSSSEDIALTTTQQDVVYKSPNGDDQNTTKAWTLTPESGKQYTVWLDYSTPSTPKIWYDEGSAAASKDFKLLNNDDESVLGTSTNGLYTLDLSAETTDKVVKLNVDGADWKLASATTAVTSGTETYAFNVSGISPLTFKAGYKYTLKLTEDGTLTVTATAAAQTRILTEGYYLVGNFFYSEDNNINYDNAIFKFQQQSSSDANLVNYMVEIPATVTAKAQILAVNAKGEATVVWGPGSKYEINNQHPSANGESESGTPSANEEKDFSEDSPAYYWNITSRRKENDKVEDGSYAVTITYNKAENKLTNWEFKYNGLKRVAYFLSTERDATALTIGGVRTDVNSNFEAGKHAGSVYIKKGGEYYAISNAIMNNSYHQYKEQYPNSTVYYNEYPTYDKLFYWGNGGHDVTNSKYTKIAPDNGTFLYDKEEGLYVLEFNTNKGDDALAKVHGGMSAEVYNPDGSATVKAVSMVGPAIPGTMIDDTKWNWESKVANMDWSANENCYKLTLSTSVGDGEKTFRFVGNNTQEINWFENDEKACTPYTNPKEGEHSATASDPNEVSITKKGTTENTDESLNIIWNRPAGKWTVRFYFYTVAVGNNPVTRYFYTITENDDLELRDFGDVTYKGNVRNILYRGKYRYFRAWSDSKAWKVPDGVDVFVVDGYTAADENTNTPASFSLKQIDDVDTYGVKGVIPANTGVILAATEDVQGTYVKTTSPTGYNVMRIAMEEADDNSATCSGIENKLLPLVYATNIPSRDEKGYNYLFGFYNAHHAFPDDYSDTKDFLLGFWLSNGNGQFHANACYLPLTSDEVKGLGIGVSYKDLGTSAGAKKAPALLFDFAKVNNNTTGINTVANTKVVSNDKYYTLSGVMVEKPTAKGIYIHNGKKYIVK